MYFSSIFQCILSHLCQKYVTRAFSAILCIGCVIEYQLRFSCTFGGFWNYSEDIDLPIVALFCPSDCNISTFPINKWFSDESLLNSGPWTSCELRIFRKRVLIYQNEIVSYKFLISKFENTYIVWTMTTWRGGWQRTRYRKILCFRLSLTLEHRLGKSKWWIHDSSFPSNCTSYFTK